MPTAFQHTRESQSRSHGRDGGADALKRQRPPGGQVLRLALAQPSLKVSREMLGHNFGERAYHKRTTPGGFGNSGYDRSLSPLTDSHFCRCFAQRGTHRRYGGYGRQELRQRVQDRPVLARLK